MAYDEKNGAQQRKAADEDVLSRAFAEVGAEHGYDNVTASFSATREFKVQWQRSYKWADFRVSDYLRFAGEAVYLELAEVLFLRITGKDEEAQYREKLRDYVLAPEFAETKRPIYLNRSRNLTKTSAGIGRDLADSVRRLKEMGLWKEEHDDIRLVWSKGVRIRRAASCSVLMKLISVNDLLDDPDIPDMAVDFAVYSQYLRIVKGQEVFGRGEIFTREEERLFPAYRDAERLLDKLSLFV